MLLMANSQIQKQQPSLETATPPLSITTQELQRWNGRLQLNQFVRKTSQSRKKPHRKYSRRNLKLIHGFTHCDSLIRVKKYVKISSSAISQGMKTKDCFERNKFLIQKPSKNTTLEEKLLKIPYFSFRFNLLLKRDLRWNKLLKFN